MPHYGLVAALARELTRDAVFEALFERRTYATTGARILLDFTLNRHGMGSLVAVSAPPRLEDFNALRLPAEDLDDLRSCRVGDCELKLGEQALRRFRSEVDWRAPTARDAANALMRQLSLEYVNGYLAGGNNEVILCERGIRTFETATRNTFDISAIPVVKKLSHLPIVADPSHGAGRRDMVAQLARAAVAAGADGLIIEVHNDPDRALSDGAQSMYPAQFDRLMAELRIIAPAIGRSICLEPMARRGWAR